MLKKTGIGLVAVVTLATMSLGSSMAAGKKPPPEADFLDESFSSSQVDQIVVLATVDLRFDKSIEMKKLDEIAQRTVKRMLKKSPYKITYRTATEGTSEVTQDDLDLLDAEWVSELGGSEDRWTLLLVMLDIAKKKTYGSAFGALCAGYLFDKQEGRPVWQHETVGTMGQGGLAGLAMKSAMRGASFGACVGNLLLTFPERKKH